MLTASTSQFDRYNEDELQEHMSFLHEYNEIKDVGQVLLGKLGVCRVMLNPF